MIIKFLSQKSLVLFTIIVFSFILYGNSLNNKYALDDAIVLTQNNFVKKGFSGIKDILTTELFTGFFGVKKNLVEGGRYRPFSLITFAIEYELFGENPFIGHFINILLYALTAILLYITLLRLFKDRFSDEWRKAFPFMVTLLWLFHPLHTEVIANIKGRDEIFALLGSIGSLYFILRYFETKKWYWIAIASIVFFLALLSKEMTITYLLIIPLSLYFFSRESFKSILVPSLLMLIPSLVFLFLRQSIMGEPAVTGVSIPKELMNHSFLGTSLAEQYATIIYTLLLYLKLLFVSYPMTFDYYPFHISITTFSNPWVIISILVHLFLAFVAIKGWRKKSIVSFGIFYYAITFSIVSNILFPIGTFMSERFMYMPSIGWAIIVAFGIYKLSQQLKRLSLDFAFILCLLILLPYTALTINRNPAWANDYTLFTTDVKTSIGSAKSNTSAGGKIMEEIEKLDKIVRDNPNSLKIIRQLIEKTNLNEADKKQLLKGQNKNEIFQNIKTYRNEQLRLSLKYLNKAVKIHPTYVDALLLLGNAHYTYNKNYDSTWVAYKKILQRNPNHDLVIKNWTLILNDSIAPRQKIKYHQNLLAFSPHLFESNYQIGNLYGRALNQIDSAIIYLEKAKSIKPNNEKVYKDLGVAYGMNKNYDKALPIMLKALELNPDDYQIMINIGVTYQMMGNLEKANEYFNLAQSKKPTTH